jgi:hypothetical protein
MILTENIINLSGTEFVLFEMEMDFFIHSVNDSLRNMHSACYNA